VKKAKKKKGFLKNRIESFERWRTRGGNDSDTDESSVASEYIFFSFSSYYYYYYFFFFFCFNFFQIKTKIN